MGNFEVHARYSKLLEWYGNLDIIALSLLVNRTIILYHYAKDLSVKAIINTNCMLELWEGAYKEIDEDYRLLIDHARD